MVNPSNQEAEEAVPEQPRVQRETLSQKKQKQKKNRQWGLERHLETNQSVEDFGLWELLSRQGWPNSRDLPSSAS